MRNPVLPTLLIAVFLVPAYPGSLALAEDHPLAELEEELRATEIAFAQTMADRDLEAFTGFLHEESIFFGGSGALRGKETVAKAWAGFFESPDAPFSWEPDAVAVLESGELGLTSGPVRNPAGERVGTFNSIWKRTEEGWKVVFDKGCP